MFTLLCIRFSPFVVWKTLLIYTDPLSNDYAMNTASVYTAPVSTLFAASLLYRGLNSNAYSISHYISAKNLFIPLLTCQYPLCSRNIFYIFELCLSKSLKIFTVVNVFKCLGFGVHAGKRSVFNTYRIRKYPYSFAFSNSSVFIAE